jgi:hypothetical protein
MRFAAVTTVLAGAGLLAGHALADTVPIPTVPTVTVPGLPVTVTAPTVTVTTPIATASTPSATVAAPKSSTPAVPPSPVQAPLSTQSGSAVLEAPSGSSSSVAGPASAGGSAGSSSSASAASGPDRPQVERFRSSRSWIATSGPKGRRVTTLIFALPRAARVVFVVRQLSPVCRIAAHFAVNGHAGSNRIRFPVRGSKLQLDPGTYRITARTRAGQVVQRVTIVVVEAGAPTRDQIIAARAANVCSQAGGLAAASSSTGASNTSNPASSPQDVQSAGQPSASGPNEAVLASTVERVTRAAQPVVVALLALAILLLAVASLPRLALLDSRANELLARHRMEIAALGTAAFVAVVIVLLLG